MGRIMKREFAIVVSMCLLLCGCQSNTIRQGIAEDDVLTLTEVPENKMLITMRMGDGMDYQNMEEVIESKFPDVDLVVLYNSPVSSAIEHHDTADIFLMSDASYKVTDMEESFIDLSAEPYAQNYYLSILQKNQIDGKLYYLPGPSNIYGIVYNKDMFKEYGWELPYNLDSFIDLCKEISETGIKPIQPALYYLDATRQFFTGFSYQPIFSGINNEKWYSDYRNGDASMKNHIEPAFDIMDRFIEAGILSAEDFTVQPSTRSKMLYQDKTTAMILETQSAQKYAVNIAKDAAPELGLLPFYSSSDKNSDYFLAVPIYNIAASKKLEAKGNEEKLKKVKEILAFLSTSEGQSAVMGNQASVISSVKGVNMQQNEFLAEAHATIEKGHVVYQPFFVGESNSEVDKVLKQDLLLYTEGNITKEAFISELDTARDLALQEESISKIYSIGTANEDFTVMQTSLMLAEVFKDKTDAQIGLCASNRRSKGNNFKLYKGSIDAGGDATFGAYLNQSFQTGTDSDIKGQLLKGSIKGEKLLKALNEIDLKNNSYFVVAGLKVTFAPWAELGSKYKELKTLDNEPIKADEVYTVAFWSGDIDLELFESIDGVYEDNVADIVEDWIKAQGGSIQPDNKNFILDWDTK